MLQDRFGGLFSLLNKRDIQALKEAEAWVNYSYEELWDEDDPNVKNRPLEKRNLLPGDAVIDLDELLQNDLEDIYYNLVIWYNTINGICMGQVFPKDRITNKRMMEAAHQCRIYLPKLARVIRKIKGRLEATDWVPFHTVHDIMGEYPDRSDERRVQFIEAQYNKPISPESEAMFARDLEVLREHGGTYPQDYQDEMALREPSYGERRPIPPRNLFYKNLKDIQFLAYPPEDRRGERPPTIVEYMRKKERQEKAE